MSSRLLAIVLGLWPLTVASRFVSLLTGLLSNSTICGICLLPQVTMNASKFLNLVILGAVHNEIKPFLRLLQELKRFDFHGNAFCRGRYGGAQVLVGSTGIGKVNAAMVTAALLEHFSITQVWNVGCAGAYSDGPLEIGDVLISREVICGDEGVLTQERTLSTREIGIPTLVRHGQKYYDRISLNEEPMFSEIFRELPEGLYTLVNDTALIALATHGEARTPESTGKRSKPRASAADLSPLYLHEPVSSEIERSCPGEDLFRLAYGPSLTVGLVSGDRGVAHARFRCYEAFAENMEGSAVVQVCYRFETPVLEFRGISNVAGDREKEHWQIDKAMLNCCGIASAFLKTIGSTD